MGVPLVLYGCKVQVRGKIIKLNVCEGRQIYPSD
jgi:hypothetical protein